MTSIIAPEHVVLIIALVVGVLLLSWFIAPKRDKITKITKESDLFGITSSHVIYCKVCKTPMHNSRRQSHIKKFHKELLK